MRRLYDAYAPTLLAAIRRYVPERADAEDILQDSLMKVFANMDSFSPRRKGALGAWMKRICVNEALMFLRRKKRLTSLEVLPQLPEDIPDDEAPPVEEVPPEVLQKMILSLPDGYRTVLSLFVFEKLTHREIAQRLGISEGTSASQYSRAKSHLARIIREYLKNKEDR